MAFVHVKDCRAEPEGADEPHTPDTQDNLLPDSGIHIPAVGKRREAAEVVRVLCDIRIEQIERASSHTHSPGLEIDHARPDGHAAEEGFTGGRLHEFDRDGRGVGRRVALLLIACRVDMLLEVSLAVEEPDTDEGQAEIARRLEVIPGKHAEAPRIKWKAFMYAELRAKIGHHSFTRS